MNEKFNLVEILKYCPIGMELDCTVYSGIVKFDGLNKNHPYSIRISVMHNGEENIHYLTEYGQTWETSYNKCVIYPKGKTTWEGFQVPFKDGDIAISEKGDIHLLRTVDSSYCAYRERWQGLSKFDRTITTGIKIVRFATEEEKQKLFDAIKANGYKWNAETKTLEKLIEPKFKVGDKIKKKGDTRLISIKDVRDNYYIITIPDYFDNCYITDKLSFNNQGDYESFPDKFDITTLKPFDKVLVRGYVGQKWTIDFFGFMDKGHPFVCVGHHVGQCIPYEQNKHLLNTTNDCDSFYKTWE